MLCVHVVHVGIRGGRGEKRGPGVLGQWGVGESLGLGGGRVTICPAFPGHVCVPPFSIVSQFGQCMFGVASLTGGFRPIPKIERGPRAKMVKDHRCRAMLSQGIKPGAFNKPPSKPKLQSLTHA